MEHSQTFLLEYYLAQTLWMTIWNLSTRMTYTYPLAWLPSCRNFPVAALARLSKKSTVLWEPTPLILALRGQRQADFCEFESILVYNVDST